MEPKYPDKVIKVLGRTWRLDIGSSCRYLSGKSRLELTPLSHVLGWYDATLDLYAGPLETVRIEVTGRGRKAALKNLVSTMRKLGAMAAITGERPPKRKIEAR